MIQQKKVDIDNITVHFRYILPMMFSVFMFFYNRDVQWQKENFQEIKASQSEMKQELKTTRIELQNEIEGNRKEREDKIAWIYQNCCSDYSPRRVQ